MTIKQQWDKLTEKVLCNKPLNQEDNDQIQHLLSGNRWSRYNKYYQPFFCALAQKDLLFDTIVYQRSKNYDISWRTVYQKFGTEVKKRTFKDFAKLFFADYDNYMVEDNKFDEYLCMSITDDYATFKQTVSQCAYYCYTKLPKKVFRYLDFQDYKMKFDILVKVVECDELYNIFNEENRKKHIDQLLRTACYKRVRNWSVESAINTLKTPHIISALQSALLMKKIS